MPNNTQHRHTPGPWHSCCKKDRPHYTFAGDDESAICSYSSSELPLDQVQANAALIERAPELLIENTRLKELNGELVRACEAALLNVCAAHGFPGHVHNQICSVLLKAKPELAPVKNKA